MTGIDTQDTLEYGDGFPNAPPLRKHYVDGDRIVSRKSLRACQHFMNDPRYVNSLREFRRAEHNDIFTDLLFQNHLKRLLKGKHGDQRTNTTELAARNKYRFFSFINW